MGEDELLHLIHLLAIDIHQFISPGVVNFCLLQDLFRSLCQIDLPGYLLHLSLSFLKEPPACLQQLLSGVIEQVVLP